MESRKDDLEYLKKAITIGDVYLIQKLLKSFDPELTGEERESLMSTDPDPILFESSLNKNLFLELTHRLLKYQEVTLWLENQVRETQRHLEYLDLVKYHLQRPSLVKKARYCDQK